MNARILIADDHEVVRHGLHRLVESHPGWEVCGEAATGREAVAKALQLKPSVVVLDVGMPDLDGLRATREILQAAPETLVLILSVHESAEVVRESLNAGARGYVLKSDASRELVNAIELLLQNRTAFTPSVAQQVLRGYLGAGAEAEPRAPVYELTPREREIVRSIAEGRSNQEVAAALGISVKTVETHRSNIMHKLSLHSTAALVRYAIRNGIVEL